MNLNISFFQNDILSALLLAVVTTIIVLINIPKHQYIDEEGNTYNVNRLWIAVKTFIISFIVTFALIYFLSTDKTSSLISHMKQGEPQF